MFAVRTVHRLVIHPFNLALACALALGASPPRRERPVHTFSIVARDSVTGQLGVAVQSHWFSVGSVVTWAEAGVGAVATQSFAEPAYGPRGLALMNSGLDAPSALRALIATDSLLPGNLEVRYWHAVTLAVNGHAERALPIFREVFAADRNWVELTRRLVRPGLIPDTATGRALLAEILREAPR